MTHSDDVEGLHYVAGVTRQAAAFAWMPQTSPTRFILVTSRRTQRWVFPKGGIDHGMTEPQTAAQEAFEEAGIHGQVDPDLIGTYRVPKIRPPLIWSLEVALYALRIERMDPTWLEMDERDRRLVTLDEARTLVDEPQLLTLAQRFLDAKRG